MHGILAAEIYLHDDIAPDEAVEHIPLYSGRECEIP